MVLTNESLGGTALHYAFVVDKIPEFQSLNVPYINDFVLSDHAFCVHYGFSDSYVFCEAFPIFPLKVRYLFFELLRYIPCITHFLHASYIKRYFVH